MKQKGDRLLCLRRGRGLRIRIGLRGGIGCARRFVLKFDTILALTVASILRS